MKPHTENHRTIVRMNRILGRSPQIIELPAHIRRPSGTLMQIVEFMINVRHWSVSFNAKWKGGGGGGAGGESNFAAEFLANLIVTIDGTPHTGTAAYAKLFDKNEDRPHLAEQDVDLVQVSDATWTIEHRASGARWEVHAKLVMCEAQMLTVATLLVDANIPSGKTVQLQADAHIAGSYTWIGMIASYDDVAIPFATVSADIGCGLSILPVCRAAPVDGGAPTQISADDLVAAENMDRFKHVFLLTARRALLRGKKSDTGDAANTIALFDQALAFLGHQIDLERFKQTLRHVLTVLEIHTGGEENPMKYASRFLQSLGSSGNHFLELTESSDDGALFVVTHSGSRGLGAIVYAAISALARVYSGSNVATGPLCEVYRQAFEVLCTFAQVNRILCALAVLQPMGLCTHGESLMRVMRESRIFASSRLTDAQKTKLLFGLTHNGVKTFVNHATKEIVHILSKGAVALSRRADIGIVALRAGEGCDLFVLNDESAGWIEVVGGGGGGSGEAPPFADYTQIFDLTKTDLCFAGHGAGRSGSSTSTHKKSSYAEMIEYYDRVGFIGNLTPGVLGDNPAIAYKSPAEIRDKLPLDQAVYAATLKTLVNHKEGMNFRHSKQFAQFCVQTYPSLDANKRLWLDLGLVQSQPGVKALFQEQRDAITEFLQGDAAAAAAGSDGNDDDSGLCSK